MEYIHKLNIVHRDMKPENLLLAKNKQILIVDFGLSNTYKKGELLKTACGSPCYAAPEMIAGKKYQGLMVDIWSCGDILNALLCVQKIYKIFRGTYRLKILILQICIKRFLLGIIRYLNLYHQKHRNC